MRQIYAEVQTYSPLSIRADHAPDGSQTARYVPGSTFLGALASFHRLFYPEDKEEFAQLFLNDQVSYPDLYPAVFDTDTLKFQHSPIYPFPRTAQSCKRHEGFLFEDDEKKRHGVRDSLIERALFSLSEQPKYRSKQIRSAVTVLLDRFSKCSYEDDEKKLVCGEPMEHIDGFYRRNAVNSTEMCKATGESHLRLRTHTGINRDSGTIQDSVLYNREVFDEGMHFYGVIYFPDDDDLFQHFQDFTQAIGTEDRRMEKPQKNEILLHIGTGRSRGMGKLGLTTEEVEESEQESFVQFAQRLQDFDVLFKAEAKASNFPTLDEYAFFTLTLQSSAIITDELLRYRSSIDGATLSELLASVLPDVQTVSELTRIYQAASTRRITGWQDLWGLPRGNDIAIEKGSVFLFSYQGRLDQQIMRALYALQALGIGRRRAEGFGRIIISDQFHQEREQKGKER